MIKQIAILGIALSVSGCATSLTFDNGDVNWKAVGATVLTVAVGAAVVSELGTINHDHSGNVTTTNTHQAGLCTSAEHGRGFCD